MCIKVLGLSKNGAGIKRKANKITKRNIIAATRAANKSGMRARTHVRRELSQLLNVRQKQLRDHTYRATYKNSRFRYRVFRRAYSIRATLNVRFRPYKGRSRRDAAKQVGVLRIKVYGKTLTFERVLRNRTRADRVSYSLLHKRKGARPTRVAGPWIKADYEGPRAVKAKIPVWFLAEYRRQQRRLREKAKERG